jgi:hypothetical protein
MLTPHLGAGHRQWVIPKQRLGAEYVPDFLVGDKDSMGVHWTAVELESPIARLFNKNGNPSQGLVQALRQIADWRTWLTNNRDYATRPLSQNGLGLRDIYGELPGLILIGRRQGGDVPARRRRLGRDYNIQIHSYDWLLEHVQRKPEDILYEEHQTRYRSAGLEELVDWSYRSPHGGW